MTVDARAARVACLAQLVHVRLQRRHDRASGTKNGLLAICASSTNGIAMSPDLAHPADEAGAVLFAQPLLGHRAGRHHGRRQPRRGAPAAARIAQAVLAPVRVVGMARAEGVEQVGVVLAALVRRCGSASAIGVPVVTPSYRPDRISTLSASLRCVTWRVVPGRRRSRSGWMSASVSAMPGGQPSITQPMAGPWIRRSW